MVSSSRRSRRNERSKHRSRSTSRSSTGTDSSAPTYRVEEDSHGNLVNRELGVVWPTRVHNATSYSSAPSPWLESEPESDAPCEKISQEEVNEIRLARGEKPRERRDGSPQYVSLSDRTDKQIQEAMTKGILEKVDSYVFSTVEELDAFLAKSKAEGNSVVTAESAPAESAPASPAKSATTISSPSITEVHGEEAARHYIGVRSRRAVDKKLTPGQFLMYYEKPSDGEIPITLDLKIGYMSSASKIYHFPIQRFECQGDPYYAVMQADTEVKMFPTIASLVKHYHTFSNVDPETGRLETFGLPI
ncbi:hypothetical protein PMAYCL1PPCAC_07829 [Pristionchus mayeri]|uniref:SH2 domain-containing protein n=1 Tax=Pristionchus mayeri TaxID=1317129 RepID=A0AAN4ZDP4_9BILA|nr:hypothetical protein PMAYCL1PPCAC_07829 [Pristionchus mayeri]